MKRCLWLLLIIMLVGCYQETDSTTFVGTVEEVNEKSILVTVLDDLDFDIARVGVNEKTEFEEIFYDDVKVGDELEITIFSEIRESYPVQVTAKKIKLNSGAEVARYKKISAEEAKKIIDEEDPIILDVRTIEEYEDSHIPNSLLIPDFEIEKLAPVEIEDKNAKILLYCRSGNRSKSAAKKLIDLGYTNVYDFGGIIDWEYEVVNF